MKQRILNTVFILLSFLFYSPVHAEKIAIVGGTIHTLSAQGKIEGGSILIDGAVIEAVSADRLTPEGYRVIDAAGHVVTAGLMNAMTRLGLEEVQLSADLVDATAPDSPFGAAINVAPAFNPDSTLIPITRLGGITRAVTAPVLTANLFAGQGAVVDLSGGADSIISEQSFILTDVGSFGGELSGGSRAALWASLENALQEARGERASAQDDFILPLLDRQALARLLNGEAPLVVRANRTVDIRQVIALKKKFSDLQIILLDGREAWRVADELAKADIPVILDPQKNLPQSFDMLGATQSNAARLYDAGVTIALTTDYGGSGNHNARLLAQLAGNAVASGLPWEAALAAVTVNPAQMFGIEKAYGTIEPGKEADIVVWSGDPFELASSARHVIIRGQEHPLVSRQTKLRDRYQGLEPGEGSFAHKR